MFSPVYEDVSGLFGRPMQVADYGLAEELRFPQAHFANGSGSQTVLKQQQQPQQQIRTAFSLVDAAGNILSQQTLQPQQSQQSQQGTASSINGIPFSAVSGSSVFPFEVYLQQQQQKPHPQQQVNQIPSFPRKPTAFQTTDGVKYFLSPSPNGTPILATGQPAGMLRQSGGGGSAMYAIGQSNANVIAQSGNFFQTSNINTNTNTNGAQNSSSDFSFFVANGLPTTTTLTMNANSANLMSVAGMPAGIVGLSPDQRSHSLVSNTNASVLNMQANVNRNLTVTELLGSKTSIEVFDPDFKFIYDVPAVAVVHLPPARLNITRLVLCRNYRPYDPQSCAMSGNCKFVHADCDYTKLEAHSIHVNYIWRHESLCTYPRLPAGEKRTVLRSNAEAVEVPTERILVTKGSQASMQNRSGAPLNSCDNYENIGMCYQGERCCCIHTVVVDPFVKGDYKRAPRKRELSNTNGPHVNAATVVQRSGSTTSEEHSRTQSQVLQAQQAQQQYPPQPRNTGSPDTEASTSSNNTRLAMRSSTATQYATPVESVLSSATLARLQEVVTMQLHTPTATTSQQAAASFGISLNPFSMQALANISSAGTLLYLPRDATEAIVVGPVGSAESSRCSSNKTPHPQK
ncbi:hypothetical protein ABL78_8125 [Leptomonas seymouri]|uniref:C3H1-type domain-containing protein n=1 Tax=Leptomonas seymouri TaxID=5684 RepID=A0A0N1PBV5_LEPSE|nr:hypothetical protein ABL78_8125 [Leptomonas seymouri]|eukprot:KPI82862.1 hypothetical protein ABL78_8125 [Leptomonas seymouri]